MKTNLFMLLFLISKGEIKGSLPTGLVADPGVRTEVMLVQPCCRLSKSQPRAPRPGHILLC